MSSGTNDRIWEPLYSFLLIIVEGACSHLSLLVYICVAYLVRSLNWWQLVASLNPAMHYQGEALVVKGYFMWLPGGS
jgi:hypothetical protein